jgi:DNA-directed RNA polymerase I subunit RPA1
VQCVAVPATRFRLTPSSGETLSRHAQDLFFEKMLTLNQSLLSEKQSGDGNDDGDDGTAAERRRVDTWTKLQEALSGLHNTEINPRLPGQLGIKQLLEKKQGLFRMNMMGKRVNFAARSVISPDVNLATNEVGIPHEFARTLVVKEHVCGYNHEALVRAVLNGPSEWPGANVVEVDKTRIDLSAKFYRRREARVAVAARLAGYAQRAVVHRHVRDGDHVLMNRQPTLHKPSIMAHRVRVLGHDRVVTIIVVFFVIIIVIMIHPTF